MSDIRQGIELFNEAEFFAAHDFFEDLWIESSSDSKLFYQGLIHISVGSFHLVSGNSKGALSQFSKGKTKLEKFNPVFLNVDVGSLVVDIESMISVLKEIKEDFSPVVFVNSLPKIKYCK